eukprot:2219294-Prymnesium_polylepis.1
MIDDWGSYSSICRVSLISPQPMITHFGRAYGKGVLSVHPYCCAKPSKPVVSTVERERTPAGAHAQLATARMMGSGSLIWPVSPRNCVRVHPCLRM